MYLETYGREANATYALLNSPQQLVLQADAVDGTFLRVLNRQMIRVVTLAEHFDLSQYDYQML